MEKNFRIGQSNELVRDGKVFDLHNCYDYKGIILKGSRLLLIFFEPNLQHDGGQAPILLEFAKVTTFEVSQNFGGADVADLDEMGYKTIGDSDYNWLLDEQQATKDDDLVFRFDNNHFIRINSLVATLRDGIRLPVLELNG
ncbi:MAG: hypothetical protein LZF86_190043 [Nitrospira sp.]|nr:MAG: hypothetical protein LZF86_190043 [Nitrospira sp.]